MTYTASGHRDAAHRLRRPAALLLLGAILWVVFGVLEHALPARHSATVSPSDTASVSSSVPANAGRANSAGAFANAFANAASVPSASVPSAASTPAPTPTPTPAATPTGFQVQHLAPTALPTLTATTGSTTVSTPSRSAKATGPAGPTGPTAPTGGDGGASITVGTKPSQSVTILLLLTVISVAPSLLLLMTSFTKIFVVLSITRNALGLTNVPPNQVLAGLSLFVSMFVMGPVLTKVNDAGIQPYLKGTKTQSVAFHDGIEPLRTFMLAHTRPNEIALMLRSANLPNPAHTTDVGLGTLIPAFVLSELRSAMIIGFVVYIPFLIIDLVVSSSLMSLGMMMLPPVSVSLPFKMLLFVLVDGWGLVIHSLVASYKTG